MSEFVHELTSATFDTAIGAAPLALVDFWAPWCAPCRMTAPHLEAAAQELNGKLYAAKVNVDDNGQLAGRYRISAIPCMIIFKNGKEVDRIVGARDKQGIKDALQPWMG